MKRRKNPNAIRRTRSDLIYDIVVYIFLGLMCLIALYPLYFVLIASISSPEAVNSGKVIFAPIGITLEGYQKLFEDNRIWIGYRNTIFYTVCGTTLNVVMTLLAAYPLSRRKLPGKKILVTYFLFTMFFNGGLIPTFLVVNDLGLYNTPWILIVMGAISVYNMIIAKTFFENNISADLMEAAEIDGCGTFRFFISIAIPLSKALVGVLVVYYL